jgi:hypothetical protein
LNVDCYYEIGHSHITCEDYALAGNINSNLCFAIVSDGCSASDDVDVGSRVLAHAAKNFLRNEYVKNLDAFKNMSPSLFSIPIINSANNTMKSLGLDDNCLDATLLLAISDGKETKVYAYGDGCIMVKHRDGHVSGFRIEYTEGAPYYLTYSLDDGRGDGYFNEFKQKVVIHEINMINGETVEPFLPRYYDVNGSYNITNWTFKDIEWITLISDGVMTYEKMGDFSKIPFEKVINGISGYKNFSGYFVERRMLKFKRECLKEGVGHYDDIGVSAIYLGP